MRRGPVGAGCEKKAGGGEPCLEGVRRAGGRDLNGCRSAQRPPLLLQLSDVGWYQVLEEASSVVVPGAPCWSERLSIPK